MNTTNGIVMSLKAQLNYFCEVLTMILKVVDGCKSTIGAVQVCENNFDGKNEVQDTFHVKVVENGFDSIFGTNDEEVTIQIDYALKRKLVANEIVADILSQRAGQIYDEEILCEFTNDYFESELEKIRELVDEEMQDYLEEDNLTVKK